MTQKFNLHLFENSLWIIIAAIFSAFLGAYIGSKVMYKVTYRAVQIFVGLLLLVIGFLMATGLNKVFVST